MSDLRKQLIHEVMLAFLKEARREPEEIMAARQDALKNLNDANRALQKEQPARHIQAIFAAIDVSALRPNEKSALGNLKGLVRRAMRMGDVGLDAREQMKEEVPDLIKLISRQQPPAAPKPRGRAQQPSMGPPVLRRHAPRLATTDLRKQLIRLAHDNPGKIREALLPIIRTAANVGDPKAKFEPGDKVKIYFGPKRFVGTGTVERKAEKIMGMQAYVVRNDKDKGKGTYFANELLKITG